MPPLRDTHWTCFVSMQSVAEKLFLTRKIRRAENDDCENAIEGLTVRLVFALAISMLQSILLRYILSLLSLSRMRLENKTSTRENTTLEIYHVRLELWFNVLKNFYFHAHELLSIFRSQRKQCHMGLFFCFTSEVIRTHFFSICCVTTRREGRARKKELIPSKAGNRYCSCFSAHCSSCQPQFPVLWFSGGLFQKKSYFCSSG